MKVKLTIRGGSPLKAILAANMQRVRLSNMRVRTAEPSKHVGPVWIEAETEMSQAQLGAWQVEWPNGEGSLLAWRAIL